MKVNNANQNSDKYTFAFNRNKSAVEDEDRFNKLENLRG